MPATDVDNTLRELHEALHAVYGDRLQHVVLFGSHARGDATLDSDIDVLVVLDCVERYWDELERTSGIAARLSDKAGATLNITFVSASKWDNEDTTFLQDIRSHGVAA